MLDALPFELLVTVLQLVVFDKNNCNDLKARRRVEACEGDNAPRERRLAQYKLYVGISTAHSNYFGKDIARMHLNKCSPTDFDLSLLAPLTSKDIGSCYQLPRLESS